MKATQLTLTEDLPRGEQLAALRAIEFEPYKHNGSNVSATVQKSVLRAIDDHQGRGDCFASQATIATEIGCGVSTVKRAIAALIAQDMITRDRPHHWAPNRHRVVWTSVFQHVAKHSEQDNAPEAVHHGPSRCHDGPSRVRDDTSEVSPRTVSGVVADRQRVHHGPRIAPLNANQSPPPNDAAAVAAMKQTIRQWGLSSADASVDAAIDRGWSLEYIAELFREAGGDREPERWSCGQLANWLAGRRSPPFDEAEVDRRRTARNAAQAERAQGIRERVQAAGNARSVPPEVIAATVGRRLREAGFERFASDEERDAAARMDAADRRKQNGPSVGRVGSMLATVD